MFTRVIGISVGLAFVALLLMVVLGGLKLITSGGGKGIEEGHRTITYAVLGMAMLVLAWLALVLIQTFTGVRVTRFCLGFAGAGTGCGTIAQQTDRT